MPPPAGEEVDRFAIVEPETPDSPEKPEDAGTDEVIEIEPAFTLEDALALRFDDVPQEDPRAGSIGYAVLRGWLMGADEARFNPDGYVTRAELVTALCRRPVLVDPELTLKGLRYLYEANRPKTRRS